MCDFLSVSIPTGEIPTVPEKFRREISFTPMSNPSVTSLVPDDWTAFVVTSGWCSCGFYHDAGDTGMDQQKLVEKYRKKGWSDSKIQRAIGSMSDGTRAKKGLRDDILELISTLIDTYGKLMLTLHFYEGVVDLESFKLDDLGAVSLSEFKNDESMFSRDKAICITK